MKFRRLLAIFLLLTLLCGCGSTDQVQKQDVIHSVLPESGSEVSMTTDTLQSFLKNYYLGKGMTVGGKGDQEVVNIPKLSWLCDLPNSGYTVVYDTNPDFSAPTEKQTPIPEIKLEALFVATTYYWKVIVHADSGDVSSGVYHFTTEDAPRFIDTKVANVRDLGGYLTEDGKHRVTQGMVYRGAHMEDITDRDREAFLNIYKIKTDLDLRAERDATFGSLTSPLGDTVEYVNVQLVSYDTGLGVTDKMYDAITLFADEENYPIYVHCAAGRDRTGTICYLINALLGVPETTLFADYEFTYFSRMSYEPGDEYGNDKIHALHKAISKYEGDTLQQKVETYCKSIGITDEEIQSIRQIMLTEA